eukprot:tig00000622_g2627.t1
MPPKRSSKRGSEAVEKDEDAPETKMAKTADAPAYARHGIEEIRRLFTLRDPSALARECPDACALAIRHLIPSHAHSAGVICVFTPRSCTISNDLILGPGPNVGRKTKIVCTLGVKTAEVDMLCKMIDAGMNIARLNFSHGDHATHGAAIKNIREAVAKKNANVAILLDTKGPEIRTGLLKGHQAVDIVAGQEVKLVTDYSVEGDGKVIALSYKNITKKIKPGNTVLIADGSLSLTVKEVGADFVLCTANNGMKLGEKKNCNLPGVEVDIETITAKDREDLIFGAEQGIDIVAASFVRCGADIKIIRDALGEKGKNVKIIAKIENQQGLVNFDEILEAADGIMVARGDLGMEIPTEKVFLAQKLMINKCNLAGKPVITATQMLESMIKNPRPTRAEATDVANAVFDGTDCVMLSGETASGDYPLEAIGIMSRVCLEAENAVDYQNLYLSIKSATKHPLLPVEALSSSAVACAVDMQAKLVVVITETGKAARFISKYCPPMPIVVVTGSAQVARQAHLSWGLVPMVSEKGKSEEIVAEAMTYAKNAGYVKPGDKVVCLQGASAKIEAGTTDCIRIYTV